MISTLKKWQKKKRQLLNEREWTCDNCSEQKAELHVCHGFHDLDRNLWEYDSDEYKVLCTKCYDLWREARVQLTDLLDKIIDADQLDLICGYALGVGDTDIWYSELSGNAGKILGFADRLKTTPEVIDNLLSVSRRSAQKRAWPLDVPDVLYQQVSCVVSYLEEQERHV